MKRAALFATAVAILGLAGCKSGPNPLPIDQLSPAQAEGRSVFMAHCALCHYDRRYGDLHGPSLAGLFKKPALPSGAAATDERVTATILHGRGNMPAQRNLSDQELSDLLAYLHTL